MESAKTAYTKLVKSISKLDPKNAEIDLDAFELFHKKFADALSNDLNTSLAITCVYDVLKSNLNDATKVALIVAFDEVLSLDFDKALYGTHELLVENNSIEVDAEFEAYIQEMIEKRRQAKKDKNFAEADRIRDELMSKGVELVDTREGTKFSLLPTEDGK